MTEIAGAIGFALGVILWVWWDTKRAEKRWLKPRSDWRGSSLRDTTKNRAFPRKRGEYPTKEK